MTGEWRTILEHPLFVMLDTLDFDADEYVIAGSGPLFARGWIDDPEDLDVIARGGAWEAAQRLGKTEPAPFGGTQRVMLFSGQIEVLDGWLPSIFSIEDIFARADRICGHSFAPLDIVLRTKEILNRTRDIEHLEIARGKLAAGGD
jgi:hypothetical protein